MAGSVAALRCASQVRSTSTAAVTGAKGAIDGGKATVQDYSKLLEAASTLTDSLGKAGPTLVSLIGAILFVAIAAVSAGALKQTPAGQGSGSATNTAAAR